MKHIHHASHTYYLNQAFKQLLPADSFAFRLWRTIGREWHLRLVERPLDDELGDELARFPLLRQAAWLSRNNGLIPKCFANADGTYFDDDGEMIPLSLKPSCSDVEQFAAYGQWLISEKMTSYGPRVKRVYHDDGEFAKELYLDEVTAHRSPYLLLAYQALSFAQRAQLGIKLTEEEARLTANFDFSANGKRGAEKRHAPMRNLRTWTIEQFRAGSWPSANQASHDLKDKVIAYGRTINAELGAQNAQRTIAEWINASLKSPV
jgi:hypothetical protein